MIRPFIIILYGLSICDGKVSVILEVLYLLMKHCTTQRFGSLLASELSRHKRMISMFDGVTAVPGALPTQNQMGFASC
jgi:hypothetical protein